MLLKSSRVLILDKISRIVAFFMRSLVCEFATVNFLMKVRPSLKMIKPLSYFNQSTTPFSLSLMTTMRMKNNKTLILDFLLLVIQTKKKDILNHYFHKQ